MPWRAGRDRQTPRFGGIACVPCESKLFRGMEIAAASLDNRDRRTGASSAMRI